MAELLAKGMVDNYTTLKIFKDGTFTTKLLLGKDSEPDRLLGFDHDADSMRRKSLTGRGGAAVLTAGLSLLAANNRGVVYVTVTGESSNVLTFTTRNPNGAALTGIRSLKAAADTLLGQADVPPAGRGGDVAQLQQLADLHTSGALTDAEFAAAKKRLLG